MLLQLEEDGGLADRLEKYEKDLVKDLVKNLLGSVSRAEFNQGFESVKSLGDKLGDVWKRYGGPLAAAIQVLMNKAGLGDVQLPGQEAVAPTRDDDLRYQFEELVGIAQRIGFDSVYVLVDRVDETPQTSADAHRPSS